MFTNLFSYIAKSVYDTRGKVSHTRISSYFILIIILGCSLCFIGIDICNLIITMNQAKVYEIPFNHITLYTLTLTHHLVLLGLKKATETEKKVQGEQ